MAPVYDRMADPDAFICPQHISSVPLIIVRFVILAPSDEDFFRGRLTDGDILRVIILIPCHVAIGADMLKECRNLRRALHGDSFQLIIILQIAQSGSVHF